MNLTRLGELLDLADNRALTASEAQELADEQAKLRAATEWTATAPTRPGLYAWRATPDTTAVLIRVSEHPTGILAVIGDDTGEWRAVTEMGGLWSGPVTRPFAALAPFHAADL
jgi:hypothetical protein